MTTSRRRPFRSLPTRTGSIQTVFLTLAVSLLLVSAIVLPAAVAADSPAGAAAQSSFESSSEVVPDQPSLDDPDELEAFVDGQMAAHKAAYDVPGATVAVVKDGEPILQKGYGYADAEEARPVNATETTFQIASVSKLATWTTVMQGVEDGRLDLDEDVNTYLEHSSVEVAERDGEPVTLEHLGTHTAGFEERAEGLVAKTNDDRRDLETALATDPPERVRAPGEVTSYSNYGTALAGHIVAEEYDIEFEDHVETELFEPLGMHDSTFRQPLPDDIADRHAYGHVRGDGTFHTQGFEYVNEAPAGAMTTTAADMSNFMIATLDGGEYDDERVLEPETVDGMLDQRFANHESVAGMGYGYYEFRSTEPRVVGHGGTLPYSHAQLFMIPEENVGVFVAYNGASAPPAMAGFTEAFLDRYFPADESDLGEPPEATAESIDRAERVSGEYHTLRTTHTSWYELMRVLGPITVEAESDGSLTTGFLGGESERWVEIDPYVYRNVETGERMAFVIDGDDVLLSRDAAPMAAFERVPWYDQAAVVLGSMGLSLVLLLSTPFLWAGTLLWRWRTDRGLPPRRPLFARAGAAALGGLAILFTALLLIAFSEGQIALLGDPPLALRLALVVPYAMGLATIGIVVGTVLAWRDGYWTRAGRVHYTLLALAGLVLVGQLLRWNVALV